MPKKIFVGNLSYQTTEQDLEKLFAAYGQVYKVDLIRDLHSGQSKGFAFVEMTDEKDAEKAMELNDREFMSRNLRVSEARPPKQNFRKGRPGGRHEGRRDDWNRY